MYVSYKIVAEGRGRDCFNQFFSDWRTGREVSENLYPENSSKTIPLVSKYFNEFRRHGYLEEKMLDKPVTRGDQEYTRRTKHYRGNLKPFLEYAKKVKAVVFEPLERRMLKDLLDNPWSPCVSSPVNFREYVMNKGVDVIDGLRKLLRDSIIYYFFVSATWARTRASIKYAGARMSLRGQSQAWMHMQAFVENDFYRLGKMLTFDKLLYIKVVLTVFDPPLNSIINFVGYPPSLPTEKSEYTTLYGIKRSYGEVKHKMGITRKGWQKIYQEIKETRMRELPDAYERFKDEIQKQKKAIRERRR